MFRAIPPVGHPLRFREIIKLLTENSKKGDFLSKYYPVSACYPVSSGTAALTLALLSLKATSAKTEVVLPAYSCPSLVSAVVTAGLIPLLCDMEPHRFRLNLNGLDSITGPKTLCVMGVHLYGLPENMSRLIDLSRVKDFFIVEDAAQGFGNRFNELDRYCGTLGDLGVVSFGRGKPLSLLSGGSVLVNNKSLIGHVEHVYQSLGETPQNPFFGSYLSLLFLYAIFFHPRTHWLPRSIPQLKLGETHFSLKFDVKKIGKGVMEFGEKVFPRFDEIRRSRLKLSMEYRCRIDKFREKFAFLPDISGDDRSVLLRFPLVFKDAHSRDRVLSKLLESGLGASGSYPVPLNELEGASAYIANNRSAFPNSKAISQKILTLPLHSFVTEKDIEMIEKIVSAV
jgi:dTDP-4-amino-4,6-dideoxygalactose transaminase